MLFVTIILDGVGIGAQDDADRYGDVGSNTLGHVCEVASPHLPNLAKLGLGCIAPLKGISCVENPLASYGRMQEVSAGKDSTTGHWELSGIRLDHPFPTYPQGFPPAVVADFLEKTGLPGILGNKPASGTAIIEELGEEHQRTGFPIVYTSADSVFQVAAHKETISLEAQYRICQIARDEVCVDAHGVGRVIARPFEGAVGAYQRVSAERKDFSLRPSAQVLQEALQQHGVHTVSIGKIADLFAGIGFDKAVKTRSNEEGVAETCRLMRHWGAQGTPTFIWVNLVDFDQEYGHRNDPRGFAQALEGFDRAVPELLEALPAGGRMVLTADHGNDPTTASTDHSREYVPLLYLSDEPGKDLGLRASFNDHAATVVAYFGVPYATAGVLFD